MGSGATVLSPGGRFPGANSNVGEAVKSSIDNLLSVTDSVPQLTDTYTKGDIAGAVDGPGGNPIKVLGTDSIFNPFYVFRYARYGEIDGSKYSADYHRDINESSTSTVLKKIDEAGSRSPIKLIADQKKIAESPTAAEILRWAEANADIDKNSTIVGATPYQWNDFLWCKWYGKIPNNRLLTLRRYPVPIEDNIQVAASKYPLVPIAQAVTWWGEETDNSLSSILDISYGFNWTDKTAKIQDVTGNEIKGEDLLTSLGIDSPGLRKILLATIFSNDSNPYAATGFDKNAQDWIKTAYGEEGQYWNRVRGPLNVINSTKIRTEGFTYSHPISLTFSYKLRAFSNINPRIAMLDLISNFLSLTHNKAEFWGGGIRYFQKTGFVLPGLPSQKFEEGDFIGGAAEVLSYIMGEIQTKGGEIAKLVGQLGENVADADLEAAATEISKSKVAQNLAGSWVSSLLAIPLTMRSFLDGRAVGEWHLTVGNPMNPLAVIGNLCLRSTKMSFSNSLGIDDFPTEVKFTVTLEHGRPRAKQDIESMFNFGGGSMSFTALPQPSSAYNSYGEKNSIVANNFKRGRSDSTANTTSDASYENKKSAAAIVESGTNPTAGKETSLTQAENIASYFRDKVSRAYGIKFGSSPALVDYFRDLKTKD